MKKLLLLAVLIPSVSQAAVHSTRNFTASQEARLTRARLAHNTRTCASVNLPSNCTEAQAQAINAALRVPPDTDAYLDMVLVRALLEIQAQQSAEDAEQTCINFRAATNAGKNTMCQALGLTFSTATDPCEICR